MHSNTIGDKFIDEKLTDGDSITPFRSLFGLDFRSLAAFRVGLAALILVDLAIRATALEAHYTDYGAVPRALAMSMFSSPWIFSLHFISGSLLGQSFLFLLNALFALMLLVGFRTRLATSVCWIFLISLQSRNFIVLSGADVFLRLLLLWSVFLPLGAKFSVDHALSEEIEDRRKTDYGNTFVSAATVGLTFQIIFVYLFSGLLKWQEPAWRHGLGIIQAFSCEQYATLLARRLLEFPELLKKLDFAACFFEVFGAFLLFVPFRNHLFRIFAISSFFGFHFVNFFLLETGLFSAVGVLAWVVFVPAWVWDRVLSPWPKLAIYYDPECSVCTKTVSLLRELLAIPASQVRPSTSDPLIHSELRKRNSWVVVSNGVRFFEFAGLLQVVSGHKLGRVLSGIFQFSPFFWLGTQCYRIFSKNRSGLNRFFPDYHSRPLLYGRAGVTQLGCALLLLYVFAWNLGSLSPPRAKIPAPLLEIGSALHVDQGWKMFLNPVNPDGWFVVAASLRDGSRVDLLQKGKPLNWSEPELISATFPMDRWRKYLVAFFPGKHDDTLMDFGRYLCREWNDHHTDGKILERFEIVLMAKDLLPDGRKAPGVRRPLWLHRCF